MSRGGIPTNSAAYNAQVSSDSSAPSVAVDPSDPTKLVSVWSVHNKNRDAFDVNGAYSTDGGRSWSSLGLDTNLDTDPDSSATNPQPFNSAKDASVAIDRQHQVYVVFREVSSAGTSGEIVLQKLDFSSSTPTLVMPDQAVTVATAAGGSSRLIYQWANAGDTAVEPMIAVDTNVATITPPSIDSNGQTFDQDDQWAGNIYVAWATDDQLPNGVLATKFNTNIIRMVASSDGGDNFTSPSPLSGAESATGNYTRSGERAAQPRLVVSQGTQMVSGKQTVPAGQVSVVWDAFQNVPNNQSGGDQIMFDKQIAGAVDYAAGGTGSINPGGGTPDTVSIPVNITDTTRFDLTGITDLSLDLTIHYTDMKDLTVDLIAPDGNTKIELFGGGDVTGNSMGNDTAGDVGVTFTDSGARTISENKGGGTHIGIYRPALNANLLKTFGKMMSNAANGTWTLQITNSNTATNATGTVTMANLHLTSGLAPGGASLSSGDSFITSTPIRGALTAPYGLKPTVMPDVGIGPGAVIAADNTLGAYSPFDGRLYVAYVTRETSTISDSTQVVLEFSNDGGATWSGGGVVAPENSYLDGFSEDGRPQFQPQVAVDQQTGSVVVSMYDARYDSSRARVSQTIVASNDGGQTFSSAAFANQPRQAIDAITGNTVTIQPVPDNESGANPNRDTSTAFGQRQGLAVADGHIIDVWSGNLNGTHNPLDVGDRTVYGNNRLDILSNVLAIPAGPRVINSTMGVVGEANDTLNKDRGADGGPQASSIIVTFDRPIETFDPSEVTVTYHDTTGQDGAGTPVPVTGVIALDQVTSFNDPLDPTRVIGSTQFQIDFTPSSAVGTYSYTIGPDVQDRIGTVSISVPFGHTIPTQNSSDTPIPIPDLGQATSTITIDPASVTPGEVVSSVTVKVNISHTFDSDLKIELVAPDGSSVVLANGVGGGGQNFTNTVFDDTATTSIDDPTAQAPFTGTFRPEEPLAELLGKEADGPWSLCVTDQEAGDFGTINSWSLNVNTGVATSSGSPGNTMDQNANGVTGETPGDIYTTLHPSDDTFLPLIVPGPHIIASNVAGNPVSSDNLVLNNTVNSIDVTFDRDMDSSTISGADVLSIIGPTGAIP